MKQRYTLVIRADRTVRIARKPRLAADEVGVYITINFPDQWGTIVGGVVIDAPEFKPEVRYEQVES